MTLQSHFYKIIHFTVGADALGGPRGGTSVSRIRWDTNVNTGYIAGRIVMRPYGCIGNVRSARRGDSRIARAGECLFPVFAPAHA